MRSSSNEAKKTKFCDFKFTAALLVSANFFSTFFLRTIHREAANLVVTPVQI